MSAIFLTVVNISISASWIVLAILVLRFLFKKAPKWINGILWGIVGTRLLMPFSLESVFSLIPSAETIYKAPGSPRPHIESGISIVDNQVNAYLQGHYFEGVSRPAGHFVNVTTILAMIWIVGIAALLIYTAISYLRLKNKVGTAILLRNNIYQNEAVASPFVLGVLKPRIYLPFRMHAQDMEHVIAHEQAHIQRRDHWWKPLGFLLLTLHWFNPLMWLGYILLCRDIELACDEKVVQKLDNKQRADYSQALLTCSVHRRMIAACPLAFGEVGVKDRVKSVLNYKKPAFWVIVTAIVVCIVAACCFLTNPVSTKLKNIENHNLDSVIQDTAAVLVSEGEVYQYVAAVDKELLQELYNIQVSRDNLSLDRSEDRDKSYTLVVNLPLNTDSASLSSVGGTYIHFSSDFSAVWINDSVKPSLSYKVTDPLKAKNIYNRIANYNDDATIEENSKYSPIIDSATFDIDGDGKDEHCTLCYGPASGLFTFKLHVWEPGSSTRIFEYFNIFNGIPGDMSFVETEEGMKLQLVPQGETEAIAYSFSVQDGNVVLTFDGQIVPYWGTQGVESPYAPVGEIRVTYKVTPSEQIALKYDHEEYVITTTHYETENGLWKTAEHTYKYRLEITGRMHNAVKRTTYIVLSNSKDLTFDQTWKASGFSSNTSDYFDPSDAIIVGHKLFD